MIRTTFAIVLLLGFTWHAIAEQQSASKPRLKELVSVTGDLVRIGDLVNDAGSVGTIAVFRAPDLGHTGTVAAAKVLEALRTHRLDQVDAAGISEVVVTRLSRVLTQKEIEERIARALAGRHGFGDAGDLVIRLDRELRTMHVEAGVHGDLVVTRLVVDPRSGRFDIAFELPGSAAASRLPLRLTGSAFEAIETAVLTRAVARGEIIRTSDVVTARRPKAEVQGEPADVASVLGLAATRTLRPGHPLRGTDLMRPQLVQRNDVVTIVFEAPGIVLTMRGQAQESGAQGEHISVLNTQSRRTIHARIDAPGRVTAVAVTPRFAAASGPATHRTAE